MLGNSNKKRQISAASSGVCEPQFIPLDNDNSATQLKLIWACPNDTAPPPLEAEELICTTLLNDKIIINCVYSNGESAVTAKQTLDPIEYVIHHNNVVLSHDPYSIQRIGDIHHA